jgi:AcrR family transcriptional regulator
MTTKRKPGAASDTSRPGPGRPRSEQADRSIRDAALDLLHDVGPRAVTVEAVAERSGTAKTTIYRRYADRDALLRDSLASVIGDPGVPAGTTPRQKIRWALERTWGQMEDVLGPGGLAAVIGDTDRRFTKLFRSVLTPYTDALITSIRAGIGSGELRDDLDADATVSLFLGAYLGELMRRGRVDATFAERCLDLMWAAMTGRPLAK